MALAHVVDNLDVVRRLQKLEKLRCGCDASGDQHVTCAEFEEMMEALKALPRLCWLHFAPYYHSEGSLLFPTLYLLPLYLRPTGLSRNHPKTIWSRMIATACATLLLAWVPAALTARAAQGGQGPSLAQVLSAMGLRTAGLLDACTLPLLLAAVLFAGPLLMDWLDGGLLGSRSLPSTAMAVRNLLAAPVTEELVFRSGLISYLLLQQPPTSAARCIWLSPALFGAAHLHHAADLVIYQGCPVARALAVTALQFTYTTAFGWLAAFLLLRTGHLAALVAVHSFCNCMGLPRFGSIARHRRARLVAAAFVGGVVAFAALLFPLTRPQLYGYAEGDSYAASLAKVAHAGKSILALV